MKPLLILKHVNNVYFSLSFGEYQTFTLIEFSLRILRQIQPMHFITVRETYLLISGLKFSFFLFCYLHTSHQLMLLKRHWIRSQLIPSCGILILQKCLVTLKISKKSNHKVEDSFPITNRILAQRIKILLNYFSTSVGIKCWTLYCCICIPYIFINIHLLMSWKPWALLRM